jgi:hypothetical protein
MPGQGFIRASFAARVCPPTKRFVIPIGFVRLGCYSRRLPPVCLEIDTSEFYRRGEKAGTGGRVVLDPPGGIWTVLRGALTARDQHNHSANERQRAQDGR